ncbi:methyltransferase N6AMT1 isoform X3 [Tupaia chinensis]|uniref:methyltransferase N6AMT1 isoform X3 n=1 Tax=Tupaia chinensis TaxID=246437 RepID=UPI000FFB7907|nr:methyltransferase N6AMT1 isoform X3 [Tupaia chinensis]
MRTTGLARGTQTERWRLPVAPLHYTAMWAAVPSATCMSPRKTRSCSWTRSRCTDINPKAAACTLETARCNKVYIQPVVTDLVKGLLPRLKEKVDLLVFNPPYVVTPSEEVGSRGIEAAWAGGRNGREVMDRFFPLASDLLSPRGLFYLVTIKENNPEEILKIMKTKGLQGTTALSRQAGQELLSVLKFTKC